MNTIYIIIEENGYDGFNCPPDEFYISESEAQTDCDKLNKQMGCKKDYFSVHEITLKK